MTKPSLYLLSTGWDPGTECLAEKDGVLDLERVEMTVTVVVDVWTAKATIPLLNVVRPKTTLAPILPATILPNLSFSRLLGHISSAVFFVYLHDELQCICMSSAMLKLAVGGELWRILFLNLTSAFNICGCSTANFIILIHQSFFNVSLSLYVHLLRLALIGKVIISLSPRTSSLLFWIIIALGK
ncbi:hypothetical protein DL93DRAFT_2095647 [Clavulina sp. PMI_390]|nr:hypothetical protein DL93DRAFT_2095647 [Clavulina sp. PMI_390]